jgi:glycosyltransferase involved in cell wall biosynthesis
VKILIHGDGQIVYGAERQAMLIAQGLRGRGHEVIASCPPSSPFAELLQQRGVPVVHVRPRGNVDAWSAVKFGAWIRAERPDALLATSWKRALTVGWAARQAGVRRIVLRVGGTKPPGTRTGEWRVRVALRRYTDALVGTSSAITSFLAGRFPFFPGDRLHEIWNAVEPPDTTDSQVRRELRLGDAPLILAVGGLSPNKRHHILLDALARMRHGDAHVAVAGSGTQADFLQRRTHELGLDHRVHWLGHRNDVPKLLGAADAFALTSQHEGTPSALLEALAAGLPVISTPVAGSELALAPVGGRSAAGWLVPFDEPAALADTLDSILDGRRESGETRLRTEEGRWRARHWFGPDRMAAAYEAVLAGQPCSDPS